MPVGYVAACYVVRCASAERYFLKLWPETRVGSQGEAQRDSSLRLTRALCDRGIYPNVPYPIPTRLGSLWASFAGSPFAVFPFLPGDVAPPWSQTPPAVRDELARAVATIHAATPALADVLPSRETFALPWEADLRAGLDAIEPIDRAARLGLWALQELVVPRRVEILRQLDRLHRLQDAVRRLAGPFVLCHTDLGGDNLLIAEPGQLALLDWDDATVAPPEHDLQTAVGEGFGRFLEVYRNAGGIGPWHLDHFAFYLLRRYVGDLAVRLLRILHENPTEREDADLLDGMERWGFAQWRMLDQTLEGVAGALP